MSSTGGPLYNPLLIVRTNVDPAYANPHRRDWGEIGDFHIIATRKRGEVWESLVWGAQWKIDQLRTRPEVIDVVRAEDGPFSDKTFGTIMVADDGHRWYHEDLKAKPWKQRFADVLPRTAVSWPRWRQRINKTRPPSTDGDP